jgi:hypothetical protein
MYRFWWLGILAGGLAAQTQVDLRTQARNIDFTGAGSTKPIKSGSALPGTCSLGELFFNTAATAGANVFACTASNTWSVEGGLPLAVCTVSAASGTAQFGADRCTTFVVQLGATPVTASSFTGGVQGATYTVAISQDATGGRTLASPANWVSPCLVDPTPGATTTGVGWFDGTNLNFYTCSYGARHSSAYTGTFTGTGVTIPASVHQQGTHPLLTVYGSNGYQVTAPFYCLNSGGLAVGCADPASSGNLVITQLSSGTYTYAVYGLNSPGAPGPQGPAGATGPPGPPDFQPALTSGTVITVAGGNFRYGTNFVNVPAPVTFNLQTVPIASISTGTTTTINTAALVHVVNGQAINVNLTGTGAGCAAGTGIFVATRLSNTSFSIPANTLQGCSGAGGSVGAATGGVAVIFANSMGQLEMDHSAALGALAYATGSNAVVNQSATATFPNGSVPIAYVTIKAGSFDTVTDYRAVFYNIVVQAGQGIDVSMVGGQAQVSTASDVALTDQPSFWTSGVDMHNATKTLPWRTGAGSPGGRDNCLNPGEAYFQTDTPNLWTCTAAGSPGTWAISAGGGGGGTWGSIGGVLSSQTDLQSALNAKAALASPAFTGAPTAPTPSQGDGSSKLATTSYVDTGLAAKQPAGSYEVPANKDQANGYAGLDANGKLKVSEAPVWNQNTTGNAATATALAALPAKCSAGYFPLGVDAQGNAQGCTLALVNSAVSITESQVTNLAADLAAKAPTASPTFTGNVTLVGGSYYGDGSQLTNTGGFGTVTLTHQNTRTPYNATSNTDAARGVALTNALAAAVSGDTIEVSAGNFAPAAGLTIPANAQMILYGPNIVNPSSTTKLLTLNSGSALTGMGTLTGVTGPPGGGAYVYNTSDEAGIYTTGSNTTNCVVNGAITITGFKGPGIAFTAVSGPSPRTQGCRVIGVSSSGNGIGIYTEASSEYHVVEASMFRANSYGGYNVGGNNSYSNNHFVESYTGFWLQGGAAFNNAHGILQGNEINHNVSYGLVVNSVTAGETIVGNMIVANGTTGTANLQINGDCNGVRIMGGMIYGGAAYTIMLTGSFAGSCSIEDVWTNTMGGTQPYTVSATAAQLVHVVLWRHNLDTDTGWDLNITNQTAPVTVATGAASNDGIKVVASNGLTNTPALDPHTLPSATVLALFDANDITGVSNGASLTSWTDGSGNSRNATTSSWCTVAPTYQTNVLNGHPVVRFSGAAGLCLITPAFGASLPVSVITVSKMNAGSNQVPWSWLSGGTGVPGGFSGGCYDNPGNGIFGCNTLLPYAATQTNWLIKEFMFTSGGTADQVQVLGGGAQVVSSGAYSFSSGPFFLGSHGNFNNVAEFNGDTLAYVVCLCTQAQREGIRQYYATQTALSITPGTAGGSPTASTGKSVSVQNAADNSYPVILDVNGAAVKGLKLTTLPPIYANNAAAIAGGMVAGQIYRRGGDPDVLIVVH